LLAWRLKAFDSVGQILCAFGCIRENSSQDREAKHFFRWALFFLRHRLPVYKGLYRLAEPPEEMRGLAHLIEHKEQIPSPETAALTGRCFREAGDFEAARTALEIADGLCSSDTVRLELAEVHLKSFAADKCLETMDRLAQPDANGHSFYLRASALRLLGKHQEALAWSTRATQARPCDPDYQLERGRILEALGHLRAALRQYSKAIRVHRRNPEAFFRRALLKLKSGDQTAALHDLEECCYYENTRSEAYLLAHALKSGVASIPPLWAQQEQPTLLSVRPSDFDLIKGQTVSIAVVIAADRSLSDCRLELLEPFGWGLETTSRCTVLGQISAGQQRKVTLQVKAKRASAVNLNQPWVLNVILTAQGAWASHLLRFTVTDPEPGRTFLVLTNDHEPQIHRERIESGRKCPVLPGEAAADLVTKGTLARNLAEKHALRWTLMLDAGTAIGLLKWAGCKSRCWGQLYRDASEFYLDSLQNGHDCQMHLHLKAVPGSRFFCYQYDSTNDILSFDFRTAEKHFAGSKVNSWANITPRYGHPWGTNSRVGSLTNAARTLENAFSTAVGSYRPVLFRAGQWDLGTSTAEREKSIMALRESGILADSSVAEGYNCYERPFQFGLPPARATYLTFRNNPEKRARSLVDAGILQAVPILLPQGTHAVTPRDDPHAVLQAYRCFLRGDRVAPGRHVIMEIEHFGDIPNGNNNGSQLGNGCWRSMDHHLSAVRSRCTALEGMRGTEAVYEWLDYYTPEPVVRLAPPTSKANPDIGAQRSVRFPLCFIGDGILGHEKRVYRLSVPLPSVPHEEEIVVRVFEDSKMLLEIEHCRARVLHVELALSVCNERHFALELEMKDRPSICVTHNAALND
jgi:tetratricopeptide (TPR) repeat protein